MGVVRAAACARVLPGSAHAAALAPAARLQHLRVASRQHKRLASSSTCSSSCGAAGTCRRTRAAAARAQPLTLPCPPFLPPPPPPPAAAAALRQAISKAIIAYYQKYVDEQSKVQIKETLLQYDRTLLVADPRRCEPKK